MRSFGVSLLIRLIFLTPVVCLAVHLHVNQSIGLESMAPLIQTAQFSDVGQTGQLGAEPETLCGASDFGGSVGHGEKTDFVSNVPSGHTKKIQISES